jgi:hypothetical protein
LVLMLIFVYTEKMKYIYQASMRVVMVLCHVQVVVLLTTAERVQLHASWQPYTTTEHHPDVKKVKLVLKMQTVLGAIKLPLPIKDIGWIGLPITMLIGSTPVRDLPVLVLIRMIVVGTIVLI